MASTDLRFLRRVSGTGVDLNEREKKKKGGRGGEREEKLNTRTRSEEKTTR
jgi:hypothetical protein